MRDKQSSSAKETDLNELYLLNFYSTYMKMDSKYEKSEFDAIRFGSFYGAFIFIAYFSSIFMSEPQQAHLGPLQVRN